MAKAIAPISASEMPSGVLARSGTPTTIATPTSATPMLAIASGSMRRRRSAAIPSVQTGTVHTSSVEMATEAKRNDAIQAAKWIASMTPASASRRPVRPSTGRKRPRQTASAKTGMEAKVNRAAEIASGPPLTSAKRAKMAADPIASCAATTKSSARCVLDTSRSSGIQEVVHVAPIFVPSGGRFRRRVVSCRLRRWRRDDGALRRAAGRRARPERSALHDCDPQGDRDREYAAAAALRLTGDGEHDGERRHGPRRNERGERDRRADDDFERLQLDAGLDAVHADDRARPRVLRRVDL